MLLGAADRRLGLSEALASCIRDGRDLERVVHRIVDLVRQRVHESGLPAGTRALATRHASCRILFTSFWLVVIQWETTAWGYCQVLCMRSNQAASLPNAIEVGSSNDIHGQLRSA